MEKIIRKHKAQGFYKGKQKLEIRQWFQTFIKNYLDKQEKINI